MPPSFQIRQGCGKIEDSRIVQCTMLPYSTMLDTTWFFKSPPCQSRHLLAGGGAACAAVVDSGMGESMNSVL